MTPEPALIPATEACHILADEISALWQLIAHHGSAELQTLAQERAAALAARLGNRTTAHRTH